jgi:hypothetical protein
LRLTKQCSVNEMSGIFIYGPSAVDPVKQASP